MASSPSKRRKLLPDESPDVPSTPSRTPVAQRSNRTFPGRPSFASPTKASLARHNPQLPPPSEGRPASRGGEPSTGVGTTLLDEENENASGEAVSERQASEGLPAVSVERGSGTGETQAAIRGLSVPPRRRSRTPGRQKSTEQGAEEPAGAVGDVARNIFPDASGASAVQRRAGEPEDSLPGLADQGADRDQTATEGATDSWILKSSRIAQPVVAPAPAIEPATNTADTEALRESQLSSEVPDPFKPRGLRRSPIASQNRQNAPQAVTTRSRALRSSPNPPVPQEQSTDEPAEELQTRSPQAGLAVTIAEQEHTRAEQTTEVTRSNNGAVVAATPPNGRTSDTQDPSPSHATKPISEPKTRSQTATVRASPSAAEAQAAMFSGLPIQPTRTLRRSPATKQSTVTSVAADSNPEEPDLPPTPTQRGLEDPVVTTPPSGIHNTPSKRPKHPRASKLKSSPLKPRQKAPPEVKQQVEAPARRRQGGPASRQLAPIDAHADKRKQRDQLLLEIKALEADTRLAEEENARIHQISITGKGIVEPAQKSEEILDLVLRTTQPPASTAPKPRTIFQNIGAFLPFAAKRTTAATTTAPVKDAVLVTHLPLKSANPLPYLKAFSPLDFSSTITILPSTTEEGDILQQHIISASAPLGLFSARLSMTVNTSAFSIQDLTIDALDLSAEAELGRWARDRARADGVLGCDIGAVCNGMRTWLELASRRARFWAAVEADLGNEAARRRMKEKLRARGKRKRQIAETGGEGEAGEDGDGDGVEEQLAGPWTRRQVLAHMPRTSMVLVLDRNVEVKFKWGIIFDWTGEGESDISASARVLKSWQEHDDRNGLARVSTTFRSLVKSKGPLAAARAIVSLLMT